jgi:hypothetical protein
VVLITTDAALRGLTLGLGSVSIVTVGATTAQSDTSVRDVEISFRQNDGVYCYQIGPHQPDLTT